MAKRITTKVILSDLPTKALKEAYKHCQQLGYMFNYSGHYGVKPIHFRKIEELETLCLKEISSRKK